MIDYIKCYCGHTTTCDCGPLKEPKQETLEECFLANIKNVLQFGNDAQAIRFMEKYFEAKQERNYSEEDMKQFALKCVITYTFNKNFISDNFRIPIERNNNNQFEQFKKK